MEIRLIVILRVTTPAIVQKDAVLATENLSVQKVCFASKIKAPKI